MSNVLRSWCMYWRNYSLSAISGAVDPGLPKGGVRAGFLQKKCVNIFTVRNEVAKVMFLQASVCPRGGST